MGISGPGIVSAPIVIDSNFQILDDVDQTKVVAFQASGLTTGTTRTITLPDADGTMQTSGADSLTTINVGTAGTGVTAVEYGTGQEHITALTLTGVAYTIGDTASLADGALIYTFPAGALVVNMASISVGLTLTTGTPTTDTPDGGLGTVIGTGAVATLDGTATFENIMTGQTFNDVAGTAEVKTVQTTLVVEAADAHTVHLNFADAWADVTDTAATAAGTVWLGWTFLA
jgi:hypothetical protein